MAISGRAVALRGIGFGGLAIALNGWVSVGTAQQPEADHTTAGGQAPMALAIGDSLTARAAGASPIAEALGDSACAAAAGGSPTAAALGSSVAATAPGASPVAQADGDELTALATGESTTNDSEE